MYADVLNHLFLIRCENLIYKDVMYHVSTFIDCLGFWLNATVEYAANPDFFGIA
ncbi:hypothetical protein NIES4071_87200 [Calothrix sp. NIES-4071]|nr:hypothetical protein NIES4071_87200 [Calothrix sp. NIES-4071]BAZ62987.1 hypothetical protein NIES4105_87130 [Calothrix sp. NIES-4105]